MFRFEWLDSLLNTGGNGTSTSGDWLLHVLGMQSTQSKEPVFIPDTRVSVVFFWTAFREQNSQDGEWSLSATSFHCTEKKTWSANNCRVWRRREREKTLLGLRISRQIAVIVNDSTKPATLPLPSPINGESAQCDRTVTSEGPPPPQLTSLPPGGILKASYMY